MSSSRADLTPMNREISSYSTASISMLAKLIHAVSLTEATSLVCEDFIGLVSASTSPQLVIELFMCFIPFSPYASQ